MRESLLSVICCPVCSGHLSMKNHDNQANGEVHDGELHCKHCRHTYAINEGVPNLLCGKEHKATRSAFNKQWQRRQQGQFERKTIYGTTAEHQINWILARCFAPLNDGDWILDAGCGSGIKAIEIARRFPKAHVIAMDLTDSLRFCTSASRELPNLHLVQADVSNHPIKSGVIDKAISWGVLHHTPNTEKAFYALAQSLAHNGQLVVWLYPHPEDSDLCNMNYEMRDLHFLKCGHRIPSWLLRWLLWPYLFVAIPYFMLRYGNVLKDERMETSAHAIDRHLGFRDQFRTLLFNSYDNLIPEFQDRPRRSSVETWFAKAGFDDSMWNDPGLFWGTRIKTG